MNIFVNLQSRQVIIDQATRQTKTVYFCGYRDANGIYKEQDAIYDTGAAAEAALNQ